METTFDSPTPDLSMRIRRGSILVYRVFDIAEEVNLITAERILRQSGGDLRMRLARPGKRAVVMRNAPVRVSLGEIELNIAVGPGSPAAATPTLKDEKRQRFVAEASATIFDYGALSLQFQIPIAPGTTIGDLLNLSPALSGDLEQGSDIDDVAQEKAREVCKLLQPALRRSGEWDLFEDYVIYFFEEVDGIREGSELTLRGSIAPLILGEPREPLAPISHELVLENTFQYNANDLVVIDWNAAVVLEPTGQRDVADVIEFALTHLLEVRYYDDLIDKRLEGLYDAIEKERHGVLNTYFSKASREASSRYIEFSEFMERVDNSLKVVGDFYLAVIFRGATRKFRIQDWQKSIARKMGILAQVSELLEGEMNVRRSHWLEFAIIFLIFFEIVTAFFRH